MAGWQPPQQKRRIDNVQPLRDPRIDHSQSHGLAPVLQNSGILTPRLSTAGGSRAPWAAGQCCRATVHSRWAGLESGGRSRLHLPQSGAAAGYPVLVASVRPADYRTIIHFMRAGAGVHARLVMGVQARGRSGGPRCWSLWTAGEPRSMTMSKLQVALGEVETVAH